MAAKVIKINQLKLNETKKLTETEAFTQTEGVALDFDGQDTNILILLEGSGTIVLKAGTGPFSCPEDKSIVLPGSGITALELESGYWMQTEGEHKGRVLITGPSTATVRTVLMQ